MSRVLRNLMDIFLIETKKLNKNSTVRFLIQYLLCISPTIIVISLLIHYYPNTGLGRIVALPTIYVMNTSIIVVGMILQKKFKPFFNFMKWIMLIIITILIALNIYPQESGPPVIELIFKK
ncbi:hypothetical protein A8L34_26930 [Bacillus sp. FJAT-27264]|nr:hypothetical protein A8L34_26930 [Bacillus sp. FJAT-27264]